MVTRTRTRTDSDTVWPDPYLDTEADALCPDCGRPVVPQPALNRHGNSVKGDDPFWYYCSSCDGAYPVYRVLPTATA